MYDKFKEGVWVTYQYKGLILTVYPLKYVA